MKGHKKRTFFVLELQVTFVTVPSPLQNLLGVTGHPCDRFLLVARLLQAARSTHKTFPLPCSKAAHPNCLLCHEHWLKAVKLSARNLFLKPLATIAWIVYYNMLRLLEFTSK